VGEKSYQAGANHGNFINICSNEDGKMVNAMLIFEDKRKKKKSEKIKKS